MKINLIKNGLTKRCSTGYSWTSLFFGCFVPMFRGDVKGLIIQTILAVLTCGACWLITPFVYNTIYIKRLIEKGYVPADEKSLSYLEKNLNYKLNK